MKNVIIVYLAAAVIFCACRNNGEARVETSSLLEFPMVEIPSMIMDNNQRTEYLVRNFWNRFFALGEGGNSINGVDSISFENAFGLYARILGMTNAKVVGESVGKMFLKADSLALQGNRKPLLALMARMEHYFYDPNSPVLDEEIYLCALNCILDAKSLTELDKMQYEYQHNICSMNRVGTVAADFAFRQQLANGGFSDRRLHKDVKDEYTLLFFNNPDCASCARILDAIKGSLLADLVQEGKLAVLAMYIDGNLDAWKNNRSKYPVEWIYAYDHNLVLRDNNIYGLRAIPSLYLLDKEKRVLLKDAPVEMVIQYFADRSI